VTLHYKERLSEAPLERAEQLHDVLENLHLPDARLSAAQLAMVVNVVAAHPELFEDLIDDAEKQWWLLLYRTPVFEVKLLTWQKDEPSDWHDHGGSSGAIRVTSGSLRERHRASDGVSVEAGDLDAGEYASFATDYVHDVVRVSKAPAVSIHAYSPPLNGLTFYDRTRFGFIAREFIEEERRSSFRTARPIIEDC
jgi:hypothetical protein